MPDDPAPRADDVAPPIGAPATRAVPPDYRGRMPAAAGAVEGVFLVAILVLGYVICFALWWFGFRGRGDDH